ncbi:MAG: phage integrase, partial [Alphaproteobacteria bacterium]|nr:phage integrase [Alphaproteobacteria bacterium]
MARTIGKLTALKVARQTAPGMFSDGGGLYLRVSREGAKSWSFRYMLNGKAREMGLGALHAVSLADARKRAAEARGLLVDGKDPIDSRDAAKASQRIQASRIMSFKQCAENYIDAHKFGWRNKKHIAQWTSSLEEYAYPVIGDTPVHDVDDAMIMKIFEQVRPTFPDGKNFWSARPETASRLRGRIEKILDWAAVRKLRTGDNPARWRGHLESQFPARSKVSKVKHRPALPYAEVGQFVKTLKDEDGIASLALQFTILTASRTAETIGAQWTEFDLKKGVWVVPADRIKAGREHKVPLSQGALQVLEQARAHQDKGGKASEWVFPSYKHTRPLSNMAMLALLKRLGRTDITVHGFRSSFRDWAAEQTNFPREIAEAALAHISGDKVEASYLRTDHFS